jgi:hypothetical protein
MASAMLFKALQIIGLLEEKVTQPQDVHFDQNHVLGNVDAEIMKKYKGPHRGLYPRGDKSMYVMYGLARRKDVFPCLGRGEGRRELDTPES